MTASFRMKSFTIRQDRCAMKVGTDAILLGGWATAAAPRSILDIGTGTGILALMLAQRFPECNVHAVDIDSEACDEAADNVANSPFAARVSVHRTAIQEFATDRRFDLVVCNPPFFSNSLKSPDVGRNIARHNTTLSLDALAMSVDRLLAGSGRCCLILPADVSETFHNVARRQRLFCEQKCLVKPTPNSPVKRHLLAFGRQEPPPFVQTTELIVEAARHQYSDDFRTLARAFLLKL
ncbi:MAG: methyltransferase [Planctomycetaceae bacterium]